MPLKYAELHQGAVMQFQRGWTAVPHHHVYWAPLLEKHRHVAECFQEQWGSVQTSNYGHYRRVLTWLG